MSGASISQELIGKVVDVLFRPRFAANEKFDEDDEHGQDSLGL